jgi:hypothetical protein
VRLFLIWCGWIAVAAHAGSEHARVVAATTGIDEDQHGVIITAITAATTRAANAPAAIILNP